MVCAFRCYSSCSKLRYFHHLKDCLSVQQHKYHVCRPLVCTKGAQNLYKHYHLLNYTSTQSPSCSSVRYCKAYSVDTKQCEGGATDTIYNNASDCYEFNSKCSDEVRNEILNSFEVCLNFVSEEEEQSLLQYLQPRLERMRYERDHWDDAIQGYRETEIPRWSSSCAHIIERLRMRAFPDTDRTVKPLTHILDLAADGCIMPHIDSVKFCGNTIAGVSLCSQAIMRLVKDDNKEVWVDVLLPRRSLYVMRNESRYNYTHEILSNSTSPSHKGKPVMKTKRISIICRNEN